MGTRQQRTYWRQRLWNIIPPRLFLLRRYGCIMQKPL